MEIIKGNTGLRDLKIACILDDSAYEWFRHECILIPVELNDWQNTLIKTKPDMLFVQSAWEGTNGQWRYKITNLQTKTESMLKVLVDWCKSNGIPTIFWNKEDPYHFDRFIAAAKLFDYIFTTDSNCIPRYIKHVDHVRIYTLPFAAQPKIHNPIDKDKEKLGKVAFCGSWYQNGHEERKKDIEIVLKPALDYDLHIYDRMQNYPIDENFKFPDIYQPNIVGSVPYNDIINTYKKYDVVLNVNSVQNSPTMFSCRAIELLACGISVISGYALGLEKTFPDLVKLSNNESDTKKHLNLLLNNKELRDRLAVRGIREALTNHTMKKRLEFVVEKVGINYEKEDIPGVSIITSTNKQKYMDEIFNNYQRQNYSNKELIIILNNDSMPLNKWVEKAKDYENVKVFQVEEKYNLGTCLNYGIENASFEYIAKMDDDDYYGPEYCGDVINAFMYSEADVVGKQSNYIYFEQSNILALKAPNKENRFTNFVAGSSICLKRNVFEKVKFSTDRKSGSDTIFLQECNAKGFKIYSTDRFNHVGMKHASQEEHTWKISDEDLLKSCIIVCYTKDYITPTTV
jgi:spore maturation protein CgeB